MRELSEGVGAGDWRRRLRRQQSRPLLLVEAGAAPCRRHRQPALGRALEPALDDPRVSVRRGLCRRRPRAATCCTDEYDYIFHLCTYHGNQSSIHDPLADHEHNQLTDAEAVRAGQSTSRRCASWCIRAPAVPSRKRPSAPRKRRRRTAPVSFEMDSPYSISKLVGELYGVYYAKHHRVPIVRARFQNVYGPARFSGPVGGVARRRRSGGTSRRHSSSRRSRQESLPLEGGGHASGISSSSTISPGTDAMRRCAAHRATSTTSRAESKRRFATCALTINQITGNRDRRRPRRPAGRGIARAADSAVPSKAKRELGFQAQMSVEQTAWNGPSAGPETTCTRIKPASRGIADRIARI